MSQWNSEEGAAKPATAGGGWSNGPGPQQTQTPQTTAMDTDDNDRAMEQNGPNSRGWGPSGETKQNSIVVDERDTESWPAITPKVGESPGSNGETIKVPSSGSPPSSSSSNATVSASLPNHNAMDTQQMSDNNPPPAAVSSAAMNSIWRNSTGGAGGAGPSTWEGGITTSPAIGKTVTTPTSQYLQQGFGGSGGGPHNATNPSSAWDKSANPGANPGATSPNNSGDPSGGWLAGPRTGATAEGPQDASGPKSSAGGMPPGNNSAPASSQPPGKGPASASSSGWLPTSEPGLGFGGGNPGATNTTNSASNQPWNNVPTNHGFGAAGSGNSSSSSSSSSSQQWKKQPGNPTSQGPAGVNAGGWGNQGSSWPPSSSNTNTSSSNSNSMGWGNLSGSGWGDPLPTNNPGANSRPTSGGDSGWGKPDMGGGGGGKGWGDAPKQDTGVSQWGAPPPSNSGGWGDAPSSGPNQSGGRTEPAGWGNPSGPPPPSNNSNQGWGAPPPQQPNSWAQTAGKGIPPEKPAPNSLSASLDTNSTAKVNSNEGWGKTQINQTAKWDVDQQQNAGAPARQDDGTAAWGQPQPPPPNANRAWGKEAPPSAWGNPAQAPPKAPTSGGWGNPPAPTSQPPPAWGNPNSGGPPNAQNQGGRAWVVNNSNNSSAPGPPGAGPPGGGPSGAGPPGAGPPGAGPPGPLGHGQGTGGMSQWGKPPPASNPSHGWGNSNPGGSAADNGTGAWGRPPPSNWGEQTNQPPPSGPPPTGPPPSGPPPTGPPPSGPPPSGPPPSGIPPSGPPPTGPPPPGPPPTGPPPSVPPPSGPPPSNTDVPTSPEVPRIISGCTWQNMGSTTVATGWGDLAQEPPRKISADDGTYVWGDSNEHNMRITHTARVNMSQRMAQSSGGQRPLSTMQQGDPPSARPPSQVDQDGTSAWGDANPSTNQWTNPNAKPDNKGPSASAWGAAPSSKPAGGVGQWGQDDSTNSSPWGRSTSHGSTKDTMQGSSWNDDSTGGSVGHWNDNDDKWESHSHSSESSVSSSGWRQGRKQPNRAVGVAGQKESNHWISKLKRLMDQGYRKEEAEMALRKHNMHFESALNDLTQQKPSDMESQFGQMNIGGLLQGGSGLQDKFPGGDNVPGSQSSLPPTSNLLTSPMVPNAPGGSKQGFGSGQGLGLSGNNHGMQQSGQQQQPFGGLQQQMPPNQPLRGPFNPQQLLQQQQQQQAFLQLAVQAGLINQSLLQQQLTPQLFMAVFQLIQQQMQRYQQLQNLPNKGMGGLNTTRQQHELILRLAAMQQLLQQQPQQQQQQQQQPNQQRPMQQQQQRAPFPSRNKPSSDSDIFGNPDIPGGTGGFNQDLGIKEPQQSRLQQFFNQRTQSLGGSTTKAPEAFGTTLRSDSVNSASDLSSRSEAWSRSNSPTTSDMPRSADSAFSDSANWSFPTNNDLDNLSDIGPPEFKPGVPWKPRSTKDVANDPHATPGSVNNGILSTPNLPKTENRNSRNDDLTGILTKPMKPPPTTSSGSWSAGPAVGQTGGGGVGGVGGGGAGRGGDYKKWNYPEQVYTPTTLTHEIWRAPLNPQGGTRNVRPPPGLVEPPSNNSLWQGGQGGGNQQPNPGRNWSRSQSTTGTSWSGGGGGSDLLSTNWLVLRNLTPQIDGSTLRLLCNQHGPLEHFHLNLSQGTALIAYRTPDEAQKAQRTLHSCVLGNTTIIVDFATQADMARFKDRTQSSSGSGPGSAGGSSSSSGGWSHGANGNKYGGGGGGGSSQWNGAVSSSIPSIPGNQMWSTGTPSMGWGGTDEGDVSNSSPIGFLPGNLLEGSM